MKVIEVNSDQLEKLVDFANQEEKQIEIKSASLKDHFLTYSYELLVGLMKGDELSRKGVHIVHDDMLEAFKKLDVFLAHIDGLFHWSNNQTPLSELEAHESLENYGVTAFKITGSDENRSVILTGSKTVTYGVIGFTTPKIKLDNSNYLYIEELNNYLKIVIEQVEAYMNGKTAPQYEQLSMEFPSEDDGDEDFENAKID
ncbi:MULTISPECIES: hypothetical protein [Chryseobacterium]|uniref:Uncharacterized protein n=1 Tax=Chryseobacterium gambrini TaxID=373672 RepID=A0A1N7LG22_9FLAO|nr:MULTISPECIES: hypothetical protein [Chryseobacterium]SIS72721.1 hypothetical protein SAMN05421785_102209 [Chryseobacterium gambrini]